MKVSSRERLELVFKKSRPYIGVVFLQVGLAGMYIISKAAFDEGLSNYVFAVYRHAVATILLAPFAFFLEHKKKIRPKMTISTLLMIMLLGLLEPVIGQILYFMGMNYTTATFAAAMANVLPAITFVMAWCFRLEKVKLMSIRSQAKIIGTVATVGGAMIMTLINGPNLNLPWTKAAPTFSESHPQHKLDLHHSIKGAIMIIVGCLSWSLFMILQFKLDGSFFTSYILGHLLSVTIKNLYPAEVSLTAWICFFGTVEGAVVALIAERGNPAAWYIKWDTKLTAVVYSGIVCSGIGYYLQGVIMKERGPVFVTAFSPLTMVIVAIMSSFILGEQMYLGRVVGAVVIVVGLYFVIWGKQNDYKSPPTQEKELPLKQTLNKNNGFESSIKDLEVITSEVKGNAVDLKVIISNKVKGNAIEDDERAAA